MKKFGKVIICILVVLLAIGISYLIYYRKNSEVNSNSLANKNTNSTNTNEIIDKNEDYIGEEEIKEDSVEPETSQEDDKTETGNQENNPQTEQTELTGKDKAIDIVKKQYAMNGEIVTFDHMEGNNYIVKINDGPAVTWYLVDGTTWEANEY